MKQAFQNNSLNYLARNQSIFIEQVHRAHSMITVSDNDSAITLVSDEENRRQLFSCRQLYLILFYMRIVDAQHGQPRGSENILRLKFCDVRAPQCFDVT